MTPPSSRSPLPPPLNPSDVERVYRAHFDNDDRLPYCDTELARAFVADLASRVDPAAGRVLRDTLGPFVAGDADADQRRAVLHRLARAAFDKGSADVFARHDLRIADGPLADFISSVNSRDGNRTVVFVAMMPYFVILREAIALRRRGYRAHLLSLSPLPAGLSELFGKHFDAVADTQQSPRLLRAVLSRLQADVLHVQCWMWTYILGRLAIEQRGRAAVICEFYDITSVYADRAALSLKWQPALVDVDVAMEAYVLNHADGIVSRLSAEALDFWVAEHRISPPPILEMQAWPTAEFMPAAEMPRQEPDGPPRLVYAGGLIPVDADHPPELFPEVGMPKAFDALLRGGARIDVYSNPQTAVDPNDPAYGAYARLAREFETFRILPGVPPDALSRTIGGYDFGLLLFDFDQERSRMRDVQRRGVVATKIFAYLEAGLPIIVNAEYEHMARIAVDNGVGLAVASADIPGLTARLATFDHAAARAAVGRFNARNGMDQHIGGLTRLYDHALERAQKRRESA